MFCGLSKIVGSSGPHYGNIILEGSLSYFGKLRENTLKLQPTNYNTCTCNKVEVIY